MKASTPLRNSLFALALGAVAAARLAAQDVTPAVPAVKVEDLPAAGAAAAPATAAETTPAASPAAAEAPPAEGEVRMRAEHQEGTEGHYIARGFVDLRAGGLRIQCDALDFFEDPRPDGTKSQRIVAVGNVVFMKGEERLAGDRLEMDLDTGLGTLTNASGFVQPGVFVEAKTVIRLGEQRYRIEGGTFTACAQPNPRWRFSLRSANLTLEDKVVARNVVLRIKSVPVFWLPAIAYPIDSDERSSGFLFPHYGSSRQKGKTVGSAFFWAMGRTLDQTISADWYSEVGYGLGHEFRYAGAGLSRTNLSTYVYNPENKDERDWDIRWDAIQMLPARTKLTMHVQQYSNLSFNRAYQESFDRVTNRTQQTSLSLERVLPIGTARLAAERTDIYFGENTTRYQHLPGLSISQYPRKIAGTPIVFGYDAAADWMGRGEAETLEMYSRYDVAPRVSLPFRISFLDMNPRASFRYTHYSATYHEDPDGTVTTELDGPARNRPVFETGIDLRGPMFSRVFTTPGGFYSDRLKHVIGPEVSFTYRTAVDDFPTIPQYDGNDNLRGTSEIRYALVQQLFARRKAKTGKYVPYEFFSWRLMQTYYLKINESPDVYDPNYASSSFGPGRVPAHRSPLRSTMRLRPRPGFGLDYTFEYDTNFNQEKRQNVFLRAEGGGANLALGWSRDIALSEKPEERIVRTSSVRGALGLATLPGGFGVEGSVDYDFVRKELYHANAKLKWNVNCCGFAAEVVRTNWGGVQDWEWRFSLNLANVGTTNRFLGTDADRRRGPFGGTP